MKIFLYFIGIMAEIGIFFATALMLYVVTEKDFMEICIVSIVAAFFPAFAFFIKVKEAYEKGEHKDGE